LATVNDGSYGQPQRSERGQFLPGNQLAAGNPNHRRMYELRKSMLDAVTPKMVEDVTIKLVELAKEGDLEAVKVFFSYVLGKPVQAIELTGEAGGPVAVGNVTLRQSALEIDSWRKRMSERLLALADPQAEEATHDTP
jgi:hypothetical protein